DSAVPVFPWASCEDLDGVRDWYAARGLPLRLVDVERLVDSSRMALDGVPVDPARVRADRDLLLCTADCRELLAAADIQVPTADRWDWPTAPTPPGWGCTPPPPTPPPPACARRCPRPPGWSTASRTRSADWCWHTWSTAGS